MKRWIALLLPLVLLGFGIRWRLGEVRKLQAEERASSARRRDAAPRVVVAPVQRRDMATRIEEMGIVGPDVRVEIEPKVGGRVSGLRLREGDPVRKGEVVATIRNAELDAQVAEMQSRLREAQLRLEQARLSTRPVEVGVDAQRSRDAAAAEVASANVARIARASEASVASAQAIAADRQARLDSAAVAVANAKAQKVAAESALLNARTRLTRLSSLVSKGFVSVQEVDTARVQVDFQTAAVTVAAGQVDAAEEARRSAAALLQAAQRDVEAAQARASAELASANASARQSEAQLAIADANRDQKGAWRENIRLLKAAVTTARAQLRNAQALRNTTVLRSPVDGIVVERLLDNGALCNPAQPIAVIESLDTVRVGVEIAEEAVAGLVVGVVATVLPDADQGLLRRGTIDRIGRTVDPRTRRVAVEVLVPNADGAFRSGSFGRVRFETRRIPRATVVPPEAIRLEGGKDAVAVVGNDTVVGMQAVVVLGRDADGVAVDGVSDGARVVVRSMAPVRDGQKVVPVDERDGDAESAPKSGRKSRS